MRIFGAQGAIIRFRNSVDAIEAMRRFAADAAVPPRHVLVKIGLDADALDRAGARATVQRWDTTYDRVLDVLVGFRDQIPDGPMTPAVDLWALQESADFALDALRMRIERVAAA